MLLHIQNIAVTFTTVFLLIFMREAPKLPPSHHSLRIEKEVNFRRVYDILIKNHDFILLLVTYATLIGIFQTFGGLMGSLFEPFGLSPGETSFYGALLLASGIIAAPVICTIVGRCKKYLLLLRTLISIMALTFASTLAII